MANKIVKRLGNITSIVLSESGKNRLLWHMSMRAATCSVIEGHQRRDLSLCQEGLGHHPSDNGPVQLAKKLAEYLVSGP